MENVTRCLELFGEGGLVGFFLEAVGKGLKERRKEGGGRGERIEFELKKKYKKYL